MSEAAKPADPERALARIHEAALARLESLLATLGVRVGNAGYGIARDELRRECGDAAGWLLPLARAGLGAQLKAEKIGQIVGDPREHARSTPMVVDEKGIASAATGLRTDLSLCGSSDVLEQMVAVIYLRRMAEAANASASAELLVAGRAMERAERWITRHDGRASDQPIAVAIRAALAQPLAAAVLRSPEPAKETP